MSSIGTNMKKIRIEKTQIENENPADVRASLKLAKLYDQIVKDNTEYGWWRFS